jgi:hypothetical protein
MTSNPDLSVKFNPARPPVDTRPVDPLPHIRASPGLLVCSRCGSECRLAPGAALPWEWLAAHRHGDCATRSHGGTTRETSEGPQRVLGAKEALE